jgi:hypothetical protein
LAHFGLPSFDSFLRFSQLSLFLDKLLFELANISNSVASKIKGMLKLSKINARHSVHCEVEINFRVDLF